MLGGVAAGFARYFDADPALVRIVFVLLALLTHGLGVLAYLVLWVVLPDAGGESAVGSDIGSGYRARGGGDGGVVVGLILIFVGGLWLYRQLTGISIDLRMAMSVALIAIGALLVVTGGRVARGSLIGLGVLLAILLGTAFPVQQMTRMDSGFGDRVERPVSASALRPSYSHAFGSMVVDLRAVDFPAGTTRVEANTSFGSMVVILPPDVAAHLHGEAAFGSIQALGRQVDGITRTLDVRTDDFDTAPRRIELDVSTAFGSAEVRR